ncbi:MAG: polysaccharide deacetylase family protein [Candidatus Thiodiazotropha sp. (ex Monitilora ramsayi)]|nr:polysaccharide deacetylase family protein [Candidatus Thiodiazotropha sp. (ex Monitilora ramsayi)]
MDEGVESEWVPLRIRTSRQLFDEILKLAKKYLNFVSIDQAVDMINGTTPIIPNSCVITFDDGQLNNFTIALPILRKHGIPATFYPTTLVLNKGTPYWFDRLDYAIQQPGLDKQIVRVGDMEILIDQSSREALADSLSKLIRSLKKKDQSDEEFHNEVSDICDTFEQISGHSIHDLAPGDPWSAPMSWSDIIKCAKSDDVAVGGHTVSHIRLPFASDSVIREELQDSKIALEKEMGLSCDHFCYPNGDWDNHTIELVMEAGYKSAVTTDEGSNKVGDDLFSLKRYTFPTSDGALKGLFAVTGVLHAMSSRKIYE